MLSEKEEAGTEARKGSEAKQWNNEGGSTAEDEKIKSLRGLSVKMVIHHYADPS